MNGIIWIVYVQVFFSTGGIGVADNSRIDSQLVLNSNGFGLNNNLDIISESYYNNSYRNFSLKITSTVL